MLRKVDLLSVEGLGHVLLHLDEDVVQNHVKLCRVVVEHRAKHREAVDQL